MATEHVLDRLEKMLAAATPGPWAYDDGVTDGDRTTGDRGKHPWVTTAACNRMICQPDGDADSDVKEHLLPTTAEMDGNGDLIAALRNAAPALIRLARAAKAVNTVEVDSPEIIDVFDELSAAVKALAEVRL